MNPPTSLALSETGFDLPALLRREALVHSVEIAGEQSRLVAAGAGADFQHRGPRIGRVARQHGERERAFPGRQFAADAREIVLGHRAHLGIIEQRLEFGGFVAHRHHLARGGSDRLQLGIVAARLDERLALELPGRHARLEFGEAAGDLAQAVVGDHDRGQVRRTRSSSQRKLGSGSVTSRRN